MSKLSRHAAQKPRSCRHCGESLPPDSLRLDCNEAHKKAFERSQKPRLDVAEEVRLDLVAECLVELDDLGEYQFSHGFKVAA